MYPWICINALTSHYPTKHYNYLSIAPKGDRSHFIDQAVKYYINAEAKKNLREKLKQGALRRADRDLGITQDWFNIDEESWQNGK